ncbi:hypothetical protein [Bradyrhizobium sp. B120]|uniref:hypothetical protein n=1 Tax=Bradyrhizobium sp. B120 TaxID=3410088 RepID=UPI003B97DEAC
MPKTKELPLEQIARAKRLARAMNIDANRERFEKLTANLQSELEGAEGQSSVAPNASEDKVQTNGAAEGRSETAKSDATGPMANAEGDQGPTTD